MKTFSVGDNFSLAKEFNVIFFFQISVKGYCKHTAVLYEMVTEIALELHEKLLLKPTYCESFFKYLQL